MSLIHMLEQLGANAALQQLDQTQLLALFGDAGANQQQLEALFKGNVEDLSDLLEVPVHRCILEGTPDQEEQPAEQDDEDKKQQSVHLQ